MIRCTPIDPLGLSPVSDADLQAYADGLQGPIASGFSAAWDWTKSAAGSAWDWTKNNWEYLAGGAAIVAGGVLMATGVGGPAGLMLIGAGADTMIQKATTGDVNWAKSLSAGRLAPSAVWESPAVYLRKPVETQLKVLLKTLQVTPPVASRSR